MKRGFPFVGTLLLAAAAFPQMAGAQDGLYRQGQPGSVGEPGTERPGQPVTLEPAPAPYRADPAAGFRGVYARARAPRTVIFWNRALTDDLETGREAVTEFSARSSGTASANRSDSADRWGAQTDIDAKSESSTQGSIRSTVNVLDSGRRASPYRETVDFDLERGFVQALKNAGVRLIDRTTIIRTAALRSDPANAQAVEMKALLGKADWLVEVTPMDGDADSLVSYKVIVRAVATGEIVAMTATDGDVPTGPMPYVAGPSGFVRATPPEATPFQTGRQIAIDTMAAIARGRR